ncbi:MAG: vitamin K epoxide reductase family protein [Bacteroidales bacterium]
MYILDISYLINKRNNMRFFQDILKGLKIHYTAFYVEKLIAEHTDWHTLYRVKKMLETYGVKLSAVRIASKDTNQLSYPCIVIYQQYPTLLTSIPKDVDDFKQQWNGVALIVDEKDKACEPHYCQNLFRSLLPVLFPYAVLLCLVGLVAVSSVSAEGIDGYRLLLLAFNGAGAFFSWRTVQGECSGSCHSVLSSSASKLFGLYSLGAIGLAYFVANILIYLTIPAFEPIVSLLSVLALLMPLWSIPYQMFAVKAWCKNCLAVQLSLVLVFLAALVFHRINVEQLQAVPALGTIALYVVIFYLCQYVYLILQKNKSIPQSLVYNYRTLLRDTVVRQRILESGELRDTQGASELIIHKPEGDNAKEMLVVLSPFCPHCQTLFTTIRELLAAGKLKEYKVVLLFSPSEHGLPVYGSVICEYQQHGVNAAIGLLAQWYDSPKLKRFQKRLNAYEKSANYTAELNRQQEWYDKQGFMGVPILLINSHVIDHSLIDGAVG